MRVPSTEPKAVCRQAQISPLNKIRASLPPSDNRHADNSTAAVQTSIGDRESVIPRNEEIGFYKTLLKNLDTGVVVHGPDTSIKISNPKAHTLLGLGEDKIEGKRAEDPGWHFLREDGSQMPLEEYPVNLVIISKKPLHNYVAGIYKSQEQDVTWVLVNAFPELDHQNRLKQVVVTFWDVTHLKIAEAALAERTAELIQLNQKLNIEIAERHQVQQKLLRKQHQIDQELAYAAEIQRTLLPRASPRIPSIRLGWRFEPSQHVGGDIFNYHYYGKDQLSCYILDVCGHGVAAALIAATVAQFLHPGSDIIENDKIVPGPRIVLNRLEEIFPFDRFESFFSIVYMTLDCKSGRFVYSCGGHPPPLILSRDGGLQILKDHGPVIGVVGGKPFQQTAVQLKHGDKIVVYSDGVLDFPDHHGKRFGKNRLYEALQHHALDPIQALLDNIQLALKLFSRGLTPDDDVSIMVIEYNPR